MKNLYKMSVDFRRGGSLEGVFLATPEEIERLFKVELSFGEVNGKHSDVYGTLNENEIELVTDNREFLEMAEKLNINLESGYNPLNYYFCDECGDVLDIITNKCEYCGGEYEEKEVRN